MSFQILASALIKGSIPKEIEEIFRRRAMEKYGYSKGAVSKALEAAILTHACNQKTTNVIFVAK